MRLTRMRSAMSSTALRSTNAPRSWSRRTARCLSSRGNSPSRPPRSALDRLDQPVEGAVQRSGAHGGDDDALPDERDVRRQPLVRAHERGADRVEHRLDRGEQRPRRLIAGSAVVRDVQRHVRRPVGERRSDDGGDEVGHRRRRGLARRPERAELDAGPSDSTAATAARTCGPGLPSTNGSIVNSSDVTPSA